MDKKRSYGAIDIKRLDVDRLLELITTAVTVSIDVAKAMFVFAISTATEEALRIVRFEHPTETRLFLELLDRLKQRAGQLLVLMEPTGTYGDPLRHQLADRGITVRMVQPIRTHDARRVFDGVASKHDGKDTVTVLKVHKGGGSTEWKLPSEERRSLRALFDRYLLRDEHCEALFNQIEARLARHWPEFEQWLAVRKHASGRALLSHYGSPQAVAADPDGARDLLRCASRGALSPELITALVESAKTTLGVPMLPDERAVMRDLLHQLMTEMAARDAIEEDLDRRVAHHDVIQRMREVVGVMAATAIVTFVGLPKDFVACRAFLKTAGLNMRESSSATRQSNVHITKRGPSIVRRLVYMAALRAIANDATARAWYRQRDCYKANDKTGAVVALMRKLFAGAYAVGKSESAHYDPSKLFDTRALALRGPSDVEMPKANVRKARTSPRSIARSNRRSRRVNAGGART